MEIKKQTLPSPVIKVKKQTSYSKKMEESSLNSNRNPPLSVEKGLNLKEAIYTEPDEE